MEIYKITNLINGKIYIGKDTQANKDYFGSGKLITRSISKYGKENFSKEILERCENNLELCEREKFWIKYHNSTDNSIGYNISNGGDGGDVITNHPDREKILEKLSKTRKGKRYEDFLTEEQVKSYKEKLANSLSKRLKGKTFEEIYGVEKAKEIKEKLSVISKLRHLEKKKIERKKPTNEEIQKRKLERVRNNLEKNNDIKSLKNYYFRYRKNNKLELLKELMGYEKYQKIVELVSKPFSHSEKTKQHLSELKKIKFINEKNEICDFLKNNHSFTIFDFYSGSKKSVLNKKNKLLRGPFSYLLTENEKNLINNIEWVRRKYTENDKINMNEKLGKRIEIDGFNFISVSEASRILGQDRGTIRYRLKNKKFPSYIYV